MSLFGGDSAPASPGHESDFSITTIDPTSPRRRRRQRRSSIRQPLEDDREVLVVESSSPGAPLSSPNDGQAAGNADYFANDDEDDTEERPNRFHGPNPTWKTYAEKELALAASLEQLRGDDLSSHLYNAHALKVRVRQPGINDPTRPWQRKNEWIPRDEHGKAPWYPDADWTAWPLEPEIVPTGKETFGALDDGLHRFTLRKEVHEKPSHDLEEQLFAVLLGRAKGLWHSRLNQDHQAHQDHKDDHDVATSSRRTSRSVSRQANHAPDTHGNSSGSEAADQPPPSRQRSVSHLSSPMSSRLSQTSAPTPVQYESTEEEDEDGGVPVFSADDDNSRRILQPTVRHILSNLDDLLMGLHRGRLGHYYKPQEHDTSGPSDGSITPSPARLSRPRATPPPKRPKPAALNPAVEPEDTAMPDVDATTKSPHLARSGPVSPNAEDTLTQPTVQRHGVHKLGIRDWSEVLGTAALIGWNPAVLERTAQRCTALFSESMTFRSLAEFGEAATTPAEKEDDTTPHDNPLQGFPCPDELCVRHSNHFPRGQGFRWRAHLKQVHKYSKEEIAEVEADLISRGLVLPNKRHNVLDHNPRGWEPPDPLECPHCAPPIKLYPQTKRLLEHIRQAHKYDPRTDPPPGEVDTDSDGEKMVGGVHNDGFMQPIHDRHVRGRDRELRLEKASYLRTRKERRAAKRKRDADLEEIDG